MENKLPLKRFFDLFAIGILSPSKPSTPFSRENMLKSIPVLAHRLFM